MEVIICGIILYTLSNNTNLHNNNTYHRKYRMEGLTLHFYFNVMDFKLKGHSKYNLKKIDNLVVKSSTTNDIRLCKSAEKQQTFKSSYFKTPKIHEINPYSFSMEYIEGMSFNDYFLLATKNDLDFLINSLKGYFNESIVGKLDISVDVIKNKLELSAIGKNFIYLLDNKKTIPLLVGRCHGDMTLSNMIFSKDIYLIDFLDSYIESPTMDLVKLRQDTHLHWSLNLIQSKTDLNKIKLGLKYIDTWIQDEYLIEEYKMLQIVNLIRIYPYIRDNHMKKWVDLNIKKLCEHS